MDIEKGILHVQLDEEDRYVALFLMERSQWLDKFIDDIQMSSTISLVWIKILSGLSLDWELLVGQIF
jgi:hypothetical protein